MGFYDDYLLGLEFNLRYTLKVLGKIYFEPQIVTGLQHYKIDQLGLKSYFGLALEKTYMVFLLVMRESINQNILIMY